MPRPRTKGPIVSFRLPMSLHRKLEDRASQAGLSPGRYAGQAMVRELMGSGRGATEAVPVSNVRTRKATAEPANGKAIVCEHKEFLVITGGLHRCKFCGRVRGLDGTWR